MGSRYTIGRPTQEVRLRNWPAGRVAQFKKAIELLEIQLNQTMAAQVNQGDKRVLSPRVPKVTGLSVRAGFKNFQINFLEARGIKDLLFYEIQKSGTSNFAEVISYKIPQTTLTIPTDTERQIVFFRVRCVNSQFEVGPWSSTVRSVGSSNFRIAITRTSSDEATIAISDHDVWTDVGVIIYNATSANVCLHVHAGVHAVSTAHFPTSAAGATIDHNVETSAVFRILRNGVVMPFGEMNANSFAISSRSPGPIFSRGEGITVSTIVSPFELFAGDEGTITYTLQAKVLKDSFAWNSSAGNPQETYTDDVLIRIDTIDLLEIVSGG